MIAVACWKPLREVDRTRDPWLVQRRWVEPDYGGRHEYVNEAQSEHERRADLLLPGEVAQVGEDEEGQNVH